MSVLFHNLSNPLLILDLANNHNGSLSHGKRIIENIAKVTNRFDFQVAIKFQYRDLDSFIHPLYKGNWDFNYIKRFEETRLSNSDFEELISYARKLNLLLACTPFDEISVGKIEEQGFDILKIASVSLTDWPLLTRIASTNLPIVASTAGSKLEEIDKVVSFLSKRVQQVALMHCVASYPTPDDSLNLNRIDQLVARYSPITIGYSTHENPKNFDAVKIAIAKGAKILERHVGSNESNNQINKYSSDADDLEKWLNSIYQTLKMSDYDDTGQTVSESEIKSLLGLRRGVYTTKRLIKGNVINASDVFFAIPLLEGQLSANEFSDYFIHTVKDEIEAQSPVYKTSLKSSDSQTTVHKIADQVKSMIKSANLTFPENLRIEISHHYGLEEFDKYGVVMATLVNRDYCKKILIIKPGQTNPEHYHKVKEETFFCVSGDLEVTLDGKSYFLTPGMSILVLAGVKHSFTSVNGAIAEEISTKSLPEDSFYTDKFITENTHRKSFITLWK